MSGWNYIKNSVIMCTSHLIWLSWLYRSVGPTDTKLNQQSNIIVGHGSQHRTRAVICPSGYDVTSFSLCTCRGQSHEINVETFRLGQNILSLKKHRRNFRKKEKLFQSSTTEQCFFFKYSLNFLYFCINLLAPELFF